MGTPSLSMVPAGDGEEKRELSLTEQQGTQLTGAAWLAKEIKGIIEANDLARSLGGKKKHVELEAWTTVCRMHSEAPHSKFVRTFQSPNGAEIIEAHAWVTDAHGNIVSEADSFVSTDEKNWKDKPFYSRASMAQTRALSKALRLRHSWIMVMAGYSATPADEMDGIEDIKPTKATVKTTKKETVPTPTPAEPLVVPDGPIEVELPQDDAQNEADKVDVIVRRVANNGRGVLCVLCDPQGTPISNEEIWWNTFHKGAFERLKESVGQHVLIRLKHTEKNGKTWTNIEEVFG